MDKVKVLIGGIEFENFEEMRIYSDLYSLGDTFSFAGVLAGKASPSQTSRNVRLGARCVITINSKTVMNGYLTDSRLSVCPDRGTLLDLSGVDACGWVSELTAAQFKEDDFTPVQAIAELRRQIPSLRNVAVSGLQGLPVMESFTIETGETVSGVLDKIANRYNRIFYANANGQIVFGRKSRGGNFHNISIGKDKVKKATLAKSLQDVFDELVFVCEDDGGFSEKEVFRVPFVPQTGKILHARVAAASEEIREHAQKKVNEIIEKYMKLNLEYAGFTDNKGQVWEINKPANISDLTQTNLYSGTMVVESVEFSQTRNEKQTAKLTLTLPGV